MTNLDGTELVHGEAWLARIARFRVEVWQSYGILAEGWYEDGLCLEPEDQHAIHIIYQIEGRLCGAVRYNDYPSLEECPLASSYREAGIALEGPVAIPERLVVAREFSGQSIWAALSDRLLQIGQQRQARYMISECSEPIARAVKKRGRHSLGTAPADPRFPGSQFEWMLTDFSSL